MGSFHCNEEDDHLTEMESRSLMQKGHEEDTGIMTVIAQAEAEQCQEFCPSSVKHGQLHSQCVPPIHDPCLTTLGVGARRQRALSKFVQPRCKTRARRKSQRMAEDRKTPTEKLNSSEVCPSIHRFEVSCCSDIYSDVKESPELSSQLESVYIYAESIKGCDTSHSSVSQGLGSCCLERICPNMQDPGTVRAKKANSIEALFGSDSPCDSESIEGDCNSDPNFVNADWERSSDSDNDTCNSIYSFAVAHWGSGSSCADSDASGYITDNDSGSSFSTSEQYRCSAHVSRIVAQHYDPEISQSEARHCDSGVNYSEGGDHDLPVNHLTSEHHNSHGGCFCGEHWDLQDRPFDIGHRDAPVSHSHARGGNTLEGVFKAVHCDLPAGRFDAGHRNSPVGCFEARHCDLPIGPFEAGHCGSPVVWIEPASCDLYNAFPESTDAVFYNGEEHNCFHFKDYSEQAWRKLQGVVTHPDRKYVVPFFQKLMKETEHEKNQENVTINKGFLFHPQMFLQAKHSEYREGQEYSMLRHVQNGSYGDVFSVRDKQTGFTCAAKRIPLSSFSWEEVRTWSRLDSSRVLQLYGAVQEGLNVILFMDLKTGSLAQFLKARGHFPEDLSLYYHYQVLQALEHLHSRNVIHLDVKVDNVLLSRDKKECFLCDFGLSELLDYTGYSTKTFRGNGLQGTDSHMSPEVACGDPRSDKADVWSSCCMLLHMLNGHQPWTRYYTHPLCLKIVSEPAPLWEIPAGCDPLTCDVIRGGLVKDPTERDSARKLLEKSSRALKAVGGLFDPVQLATQILPHPQSSPLMPSCNLLPKPLVIPPAVSITTIPHQKELSAPIIQWVSRWRERAAEEDGMDSYEDNDKGMDRSESWMEKYWGLGQEHSVYEDENDTDEELKCSFEERWRKRSEEAGESDEEIESDLGSLREMGSQNELEPFHRVDILYGSERRPGGDQWSESEEEAALPTMTSLNPTNLCERNSRLTLTCHRSTCTSDANLADKGSDWSDDLSSGVFSSYCSSLTEDRSFNVDWSVSTNQPPSCSFEGLGVDIWVEDVSGNTFRIRERLRVKLGHVAIGISAQISMNAFSLATLDGKLVSPDTEVLETRMWLLCVPAPDNSLNWTWRIREGKLETQEVDDVQSDACSTLIA